MGGTQERWMVFIMGEHWGLAHWAPELAAAVLLGKEIHLHLVMTGGWLYHLFGNGDLTWFNIAKVFTLW